MSMGEVNLVKVFSVTKAKDRESIGDRVTEWIAAHRDIRILRTFVALSSDLKYHCLSIVILCSDCSK
jgi:hypothetical protein